MDLVEKSARTTPDSFEYFTSLNGRLLNISEAVGSIHCPLCAVSKASIVLHARGRSKPRTPKFRLSACAH